MVASADVASAGATQKSIAAAVDDGVLWFSSRWPVCILALTIPIVVMPIIAPLLEAAGFHHVAGAIYFVYGLVCHQHPDRSFHVESEQMAWCQRDFAITMTTFTALILTSLAPGLRSIAAAPLRIAGLLSLPLIIDGLTQLLGLRESTWELRVVSGVLFALGWAWFTVPRLDGGFRTVTDVIEARRSTGVQP